MQPQDMDDIAKQLFTMELGHQLNLPASSRPASTGSPLASPSSRRAQNRRTTFNVAPCPGKEKENTPPRKDRKPMSANNDLVITILESQKPAANVDDLLARKIRKWKLRHHPSSSPSKQDKQTSVQASASSSQQATPPATDKWKNITIGAPLLKTQAVPPSPHKPSRLQFDEDTFSLMPRLPYETPDAKTSRSDEPCLPLRRPSLKIRRRPLGRPSPLHKKVRHGE